jgi:SAM-dependent methyltransferase
MPASLEASYQSVIDATYIENIPAREKTFSRSFDQILPFLPTSRGHLLEVGAYCGLFLKEAQRRGWQGDGIEPSRWAADYARDISRVNVYQGFLEDNRERLRSQYDVVVSWDVLEHVRDPKAFIAACGEFLPAGGTLCLSTLDIDSWAPRLLKTRWPWLMNMHLFYFDPPVIADILSGTGFTLIYSDSYVHFARLKYVYAKGLHILPGFLQKPLSVLERCIPDHVLLPFSLGDIKLFVARKNAVPNE